jgi:MarR family transcriptional regulator for hemolysin
MTVAPLMIRGLIMRKYDYQNSTGFIVKTAAKVFESALDQYLRNKANITVAQSRVVGTLALVEDGMTQKEIADRIGIESPTIVPMIDKLEEQGIVVRKPHPQDRRNNLIFLTNKSEAKWELIIECALELEQLCRLGVSEEELETTKATLRKITQNVLAGLSQKPEPVQIESNRGNAKNAQPLVRKEKLRPLQTGKQRLV